MKYHVHLDGANEIILNYIAPFSTVLEFGPASGAMTQFLKERLHCDVYIVEKDLQAFDNAIKYAKKGIHDDILSYKWLEEFSKVQFDFIILSNVLEHLTEPETVIKKASDLLKESGSLLISIPNIAHNDILLNLYDNSFNYTEEGLLDKTHVHFWGSNNLTPFFAACGFTICDVKVINMETLSTEQINSSALYNSDLYELLKKRELGEAYQFVLRLQKSTNAIAPAAFPNSDHMLYSALYYDFGSGYTEANVTHMPLIPSHNGEFSLAYTLKCPSELTGLRLDPIDGKFCIVKNLEIVSNSGSVNIENTNAVELNGVYYFCNTDSQLILSCNWTETKWINFKATIIPFASFQAQNLLIQTVQHINSEKELLAKYEQVRQDSHLGNDASNILFNRMQMLLEDTSNTIIQQGKRNADDLASSNLSLSKKFSEKLSEKLSEKILSQLIQSTNLSTASVETAQNKILKEIETLQDTSSSNLSDLLAAIENERIKKHRLEQALCEKDAIFSQNAMQINAQQATIENQNQYIAHLEQNIHSLKHSTCWKITKPLRAIGNIRHSLVQFNSPESDISEKPYIYNIENYCSEGNSLKITGWIAINDELLDNTKLIFVGENTQTPIGSLSLALIERNDVVSAFSGKYAFAYGFNVDAFITTELKLSVRLCFTSEKEEFILTIGSILPMPDAVSFQCMILSDNRGQTPLQSFDALFTKQEQLPSDLYQETFDIIIPIYNGFDYFEALFASLEQTKCHYRLILVNDHSPDTRVSEYLSTYQSLHTDVIVLENSENLGFVQSVNKALTIVKNHTVLLNTDIILPAGWLERLMLPIVSSPNIATTTPFTNSGTICSFPSFCEDNDIWENLSVDNIDHYFRNLTPNFQTIPTGVGFCMGINIHALKKVGLLDAETFSKGYGEENDWCQRAIKEGYFNVHVNNLFVYHKHGGSFLSAEKKALLQRNSKLLSQKHPLYNSNVALYCAMDPMRETRETILALLILLECEGKNIVAFNHDLGGGASSYLEKKKLASIQRGEKFVIVKYCVKTSTYTVTINYKKYEVIFKAAKYDDIHNFIMNAPVSEIWINELVSYPNLYELFDSLILIREKKNVELIMLLHDLFFVCPAINMLNEEENFCDLPSLKKCEKCAQKNLHNHYPDYHSMQEYRKKWGEFLENCTQIIAFSNNTLNLFKRVYGSKPTLKLVPHQVDFLPPLNKKRKLTPTFNIGLLGVLNTHKGLSVIKEMLSLIDYNNLDIKIILIGTCEESINSPHFCVYGKYSREELPKLVSQLDIDIFFISSIWPETFSYTTSEIMSLNYPIASFDIGAPAERIAAYDKGLIINTRDPQNILNQLLIYKNNYLALPYSAQKVLFIIEEKSFASRYRVEHMQEKLTYNGISSTIKMIDDIDSLILCQFEKIILYRISDYKKIALLQLEAHKLNIPLLYDIDDYIFDYSKIQYLPFLHKEEYFDFEIYCADIQKTMALCDSYIVSTESLKKAISNTPTLMGKHIEVRRNMASAEMLCLSDIAWKFRESAPSDMYNSECAAPNVWLGYFSGSKTHDDDFDCISSVLLDLMAKYDHLYLKIGGCLELPSSFDKYQKRITRFPFKNWKELPEEIASVDINLMPLANTFFNQCKSENKWMEAGLVKVPTVASFNAELALIINVKNGFLCHSSDEWTKCLTALITNPELRKQIGNQAYQDVLDSYITLS